MDITDGLQLPKISIKNTVLSERFFLTNLCDNSSSIAEFVSPARAYMYAFYVYRNVCICVRIGIYNNEIYKKYR